MTGEDRPDLDKPRTTPRPAAAAGRDPVDAPEPAKPAKAPTRPDHRPSAKVLRQFRLSAEEDDLLVQLRDERGDAYIIDTMRYLLSLTPHLLAGEYGIDPRKDER